MLRDVSKAFDEVKNAEHAQAPRGEAAGKERIPFAAAYGHQINRESRVLALRNSHDQCRARLVAGVRRRGDARKSLKGIIFVTR